MAHRKIEDLAEGFRLRLIEGYPGEITLTDDVERCYTVQKREDNQWFAMTTTKLYKTAYEAMKASLDASSVGRGIGRYERYNAWAAEQRARGTRDGMV